MDARNQGEDTDALDSDGDWILDKHEADALQVRVDPLNVGATRYREQWDLGTNVTIQIPDVDIEINQRIVEVKVEIDPREDEKVTINLGTIPRTITRILREELRKINRARVG